MTGSRSTEGLISRATVRRLVWLILALGVATGATTQALPLTDASRVNAVAALGTATVAVVVCGLTAAVSTASQRWWRGLFGASYVSYFIAAYLIAQAGFANPPETATGWVPVAGSLAFYPLALASLLTFPTVPRDQPLSSASQPASQRVEGRWRALLLVDSAVVVGSLAYLGWLGLSGRERRGSSIQPVDFEVITATAVGSLVLLAAAVLTISYRRARSGRGLGVLTAGIAGSTSSNVLFLVMSSQGSDPDSPFLSVGVVIAPLLVAVAALAAPPRGPRRAATVPGTDPDAVATSSRLTPARAADEVTRRLWIHAMLPYLPLAVVGIVTAARLAAGETLTVGQAVALVMLLLAALLRQLVTVADNTRLLARVQHSERRLHHLAYHDPLTGLANRSLFGDRLESAVARHGRHRSLHDGQLAVVYCDLDDFKGVNDSLGHEAGDDMLRAAADRLAASVRRSDTVARLGGDEFAVILDGYDDPVALARRLMTELERPYRIAGTELPVLASIGVAVAEPDSDVRAATLLRTADVAMYEAKQGGKGRVAVRRLS